MTPIYEPLVRTGYEWINTIDERDYEVFLSFDGSPRAKGWLPINVRRVRADDRQEFQESDFPWLGSHALILRDHAVEALRRIIEPHVEFLPLLTSDGISLSAVNVLSVVDALDEKESLITRFPTSGRVMRVNRPVFDEEIIRGLDIFRLPFRASPTYLSKRFVDAASAARLVGLDFKCVWTPAPRAQ